MANSSYYVMCEGKGCFIRNFCKRYSDTTDIQMSYCDPETRDIYEAKHPQARY